MSSITISLIVLASVFGGALVGIFLHAVLPQHHLTNETKDIVKLGMGLVGTMAALVLGLLVASAKGSYDAQSAELTQMSANIDTLDRALALYGPEAKEIRAMLRGVVVRFLDQIWSKDGTSASPVAPSFRRRRNSLRKNPGALAEERHATPAPGPGTEYRGGYWKNALVDVRTTSHLGFDAVAGRAGSLAHGHFHQFRSLRPFQRDRGRQLIRLRAVGFRCNFLDPGDVRALRWTDSDLQRPAARRSRTSWTVAR